MKNRRRLMLIAIPLLLVIAYYCSGIIMVSKTLHTVRKAFLETEAFTAIESQYISQEKYRVIQKCSTPQIQDPNDKRRLTMFPVFVFTDFLRDGLVFFMYSYQVVDGNTNEVKTGSWNAWVKLVIKNINGKWKIVQWWENP